MPNIPLTDLIIGNIVYTYDNQQDNIDQECIITAINDNGTLCFRWPDEDFNRNAPVEHFEFIPISEEWLGRFGFYRKVNNSTQWFHKSLHNGISFYMHFGFSITIDSYGAGDIERDITPELKYVHQLMNTFYALTGTELTLKQ